MLGTECSPKIGPPINKYKPLNVNNKPNAEANLSMGVYSGITNDQ